MPVKTALTDVCVASHLANLNEPAPVTSYFRNSDSKPTLVVCLSACTDIDVAFFGKEIFEVYIPKFATSAVVFIRGSSTQLAYVNNFSNSKS